MGIALRLRHFHVIEAVAFSAYVGWYIWRLQETLWYSWLIFPVWLAASFLLHKDTPQSLGWRADNLLPSVKLSAAFFLPCLMAIGIAGLFLGSLQRSALPLLVPRHFFGYMAFCLLQQIGLNSFVTNRLYAAFHSPLRAALLAGTIFAALHWPNPVLVPLTWAGGTLMSWIFARERNILTLTVWQALLGNFVWWAFPVAWHHAMRVGPGFYHFRLH
jgi:hypothetical protein